MTIKAIVFDAYGTLFNVYAIASEAERIFPHHGEALAAMWRDKQIEYTRLRSMCSMYKPFWEVTQDALVFCCKKMNLDLDVNAQKSLMGQYANLPLFPENLEVLEQLQQQGYKLAVLSNANTEMLEGIVKSAGMETLLPHLLSADSVQKFKTAPEVYQLGTDLFGLPARDILFVSGNCWDVCGATWFGYASFWVNRTGSPLEELGVAPHGQGQSLTDLLDFVAQQSDQN
ncbi:haloacid dehalogenase type II [Actimicrobium sp. CCI2.3]|uniref:haloacid dehalogenase type II n=1 Tax=Actimicrobium sp. CCI2.3 TaxID=3048616 RepID=UPI002AB483F3|nr:haloacid dehalogenase type II [Actimicrobium sp. CCI2.3]MDY7574710.1 haloacid dehalogenase type II [Actimicrobium sp. CCI2.3]MEB0020329.1 haloacid dehalogenase type II [Actimicrobium sp. CCI2.3]